MMSFHTFNLAGQAITPQELEIISRVYRRIIAEGHIANDPAVKNHFARFIFTIYDRGMSDEDRLYEFCKVAAERKFSAAILADPTMQMLLMEKIATVQQSH